MDNPKQNPGEKWNRRQADQIRLESWKAIANYMNRSVRTVRRWEVSEGLPVYRHRHTKGHSVYAYCSELDAWLQEHVKAGPQDTEAAGPPPTPPDSTPVAPASHGEASPVHPHAAQWGRSVAFLFVAAFVGGMVARYVPLNPTVTDAQPASVNRIDQVILPIADLDKVSHWSDSVARAVVLPIMSAWIDGRLRDAVQESRRIARQISNYPPSAQPYLVDYLVDFSLALGRIDDALKITAGIKDGNRRNELQARIMFAIGDKVAMRSHLQKSAGFSNETTPLLMAMAGRFEEAAELNSMLASMESQSARLDVILALAAMAGEDESETESRLRAATASLTASDDGYFFVALDLLAGMHNSAGRVDDAIHVLERTVPHRDVAASNRAGIFWLMCQHKLASLYREAGRERDALQLENELRERLTLADETFPLAQSLAGA